MAQLQCGGILQITMTHNVKTQMHVHMLHSEAHIPYTDISIPENIWKLIVEMKNSTPSAVS